ncbi:hypothetical protein KQI38_18015 [Tissierella carlieri]|nr:hypothetical protein [Tissierella carlieri]MBU5313927.1 hypothetical protein [Tissierella carlieri]
MKGKRILVSLVVLMLLLLNLSTGVIAGGDGGPIIPEKGPYVLKVETTKQ